MKHLLIILLLGMASRAQSHQPSLDECLEGSEFILHAAMSRDDGVAREEFIGRVQGDLLAIQSFPPEMRWFAQDADDERFLVSASEAVFDSPHPPARHQSEFLQACIGRMTTEAPGDLSPAQGPEKTAYPDIKESDL